MNEKNKTLEDTEKTQSELYYDGRHSFPLIDGRSVVYTVCVKEQQSAWGKPIPSKYQWRTVWVAYTLKEAQERKDEYEQSSVGMLGVRIAREIREFVEEGVEPSAMKMKSTGIEYETIDGKWWLFIDGVAIRPLTDEEAAIVIWGSSLVPSLESVSNQMP